MSPSSKHFQNTDTGQNSAKQERTSEQQRKASSEREGDATRPAAGQPESERAVTQEELQDTDYGHYNSGRRAAGHGGGSLDNIDEFNDERGEPGYAFSGGGRGHTPRRSLEHESQEELESRTGPYERSGQPATERAEKTGSAKERRKS